MRYRKRERARYQNRKKKTMASRPGFAYDFPWSKIGKMKYAIYLPMLYRGIVSPENDDSDQWHFHMTMIVLLRYVMAQFFISLSRIHAITEKTRIQSKGIDFKQVDREDHWDDYILLQYIVMSMVHFCPGLGFKNFPVFEKKGMWQLLLLHVGPTEYVYYWLHRLLHHHTLYSAYHSHHHASFVTEPITGSVHPFMEHIMYTANFAIPLLGTWMCNGASMAMFYVYLMGFDLLNAIGHCNFEFVPKFFAKFPGVKYLLYTPSYHSLHHSRVHTNFCLFMPIYDYAYGTMDKSSEELYDKAIEGKASPKTTPDVVFMAHGTELLSMFHLPFAFRSFSSRPFTTDSWMLKMLWPLTLPAVAALRFLPGVKAFVSDKHRLKNMNIETWVTPAWGFQFFIRSEFKHINAKIERAILDADERGVRVLGLGALNKNEALNGGGAFFVQKHEKNLKNTKVVHGNTLTAAAIIDKIPENVKEIFLTGATSKLGRAIALYMATKKNCRVLMCTTSEERFEKIKMECPEKFRHLLFRVNNANEKVEITQESTSNVLKKSSSFLLSRLGSLKNNNNNNNREVETEEKNDTKTNYSSGRTCRNWVVGRHCDKNEQSLAPSKTTFHQFVVPPIPETRSDCAYTDLPAFRLPEKEAKDFKTCEMTMERGCVHACHAGALIHALEGWQHHEVGAIDPEKIDVTWKASKKHGFACL